MPGARPPPPRSTKPGYSRARLAAELRITARKALAIEPSHSFANLPRDEKIRSHPIATPHVALLRDPHDQIVELTWSRIGRIKAPHHDRTGDNRPALPRTAHAARALQKPVRLRRAIGVRKCENLCARLCDARIPRGVGTGRRAINASREARIGGLVRVAIRTVVDEDQLELRNTDRLFL